MFFKISKLLKNKLLGIMFTLNKIAIANKVQKERFLMNNPSSIAMFNFSSFRLIFNIAMSAYKAKNIKVDINKPLMHGLYSCMKIIAVKYKEQFK